MGTLTFACGLASCVFAAYLAWLGVAQRRLFERLRRLEQVEAEARHGNSAVPVSGGLRLSPDTYPAHSDSPPRAELARRDGTSVRDRDEFVLQRDASRRRAA